MRVESSLEVFEILFQSIICTDVISYFQKKRVEN